MKNAWILVWLLASCSALDDVPPGVCGNLVVDPGEQCDGQETCGASCRFTCERGVRECPGDLGCAVDGVCVASANRFVEYARAPHYDMPADRIVAGDLDGDGRDDIIGVGASLRVRFGAAARPLFESYEKRIRPPTGPAAFGQLDGRDGIDVVFPTADGIFTLVARGRALDTVPYASTETLPADPAARVCTPDGGWAQCRAIDLDRDGRLDRVGFIAGLDNVLVELARPAGAPLRVTLDTVDIITDLTVGDLDGDGFGDIAYATRSANGLPSQGVYVVYGAPQPEAFATAQLLSAPQITGITARDLGQPLDGIDDLAVARELVAGAPGVAVYLGDAARDLSAPFALQRASSPLDEPYAVVAGEFVGGDGSGIDVMAYARNRAEPGRAFLWWLRGLGSAQLAIGAVDAVDAKKLAFLQGSWQVGDLVSDLATTANGPDEVIGLASSADTCPGPALTVAVPSARFTATDLLRSACLAVDGTGWSASTVGLLGGNQPRAIGVAARGREWWFGETTSLDDATTSRTLAGDAVALDGTCRDPVLWREIPDAATRLSWACDRDGKTAIVGVSRSTAGTQVVTWGEVPYGAEHVAGDFNGDGLTDLVVRRGTELTVLLQCTAEAIGVEGC